MWLDTGSTVPQGAPTAGPSADPGASAPDAATQAPSVAGSTGQAPTARGVDVGAKCNSPTPGSTTSGGGSKPANGTEEVLTVTVKDHRNQTVQVNATHNTLLCSVVVDATRRLSIPCGPCPEEEVSLYSADLRELPLENTLASALAPPPPASDSFLLGAPSQDNQNDSAPLKRKRSDSDGNPVVAAVDGPVLLHLLPYKLLREDYFRQSHSSGNATLDASNSSSTAAGSSEPVPDADWLPLYWHLWMSDVGHTANITAAPPEGCPPVPFIHDADTPLSVSLGVFAGWMGLRLHEDGAGAALQQGQQQQEQQREEQNGQGEDQAQERQQEKAKPRELDAQACSCDEKEKQQGGDKVQVVAEPSVGGQEGGSAGVIKAGSASEQPGPGAPWYKQMNWLRGGGVRMLRLLAAATSGAILAGGSSENGGQTGDAGTAASGAAGTSAEKQAAKDASTGQGSGDLGGKQGVGCCWGSCKDMSPNGFQRNSDSGLPSPTAGPKTSCRGLCSCRHSASPTSSSRNLLTPTPPDIASLAARSSSITAGLNNAASPAAAAPAAASTGPASGVQLLWLNRRVPGHACPGSLGMCDQSVVALLNLCSQPDCASCLMTRGSLLGSVAQVEAALDAGGIGPVDEQQQAPAEGEAEGAGSEGAGAKGAEPAAAATAKGEGLARPPMLMPLGLAAANGHEDVLQVLLQRGVDAPNVVDKFGLPALWFAVEHGEPGCVRLLLAAGARAADWLFAAVASYPSLCHAVEVGNVEVVREMLRRGACPYTPDDSNGTPYHMAIERGDVEAVEALLDGDPAFEELQRAQAEVYRRLLHATQRVERSEVAGCPCVQCNYKVAIRAAPSPDTEELRAQLQLVALPAVLDGAPQEAAVPLMVALRKRGALLDAHDADGYTALHLAVRCGHLEAIRWLLQQGADPSERDALGYTPLHLLAHYGCSAAPAPPPPAGGGAAGPAAAAEGGPAAGAGAGGGPQLELAVARLLVEEARVSLATKTTCFAYEADVRAEERKQRSQPASKSHGLSSQGLKRRTADPMLSVPLYGGHNAAQLALRYGRPLLLAYLLHKGAPLDLSSATSRHCLEKALEAGHSAAARILLSHVQAKPSTAAAPAAQQQQHSNSGLLLNNAVAAPGLAAVAAPAGATTSTASLSTSASGNASAGRKAASKQRTVAAPVTPKKRATATAAAAAKGASPSATVPTSNSAQPAAAAADAAPTGSIPRADADAAPKAAPSSGASGQVSEGQASTRGRSGQVEGDGFGGSAAAASLLQLTLQVASDDGSARGRLEEQLLSLVLRVGEAAMQQHEQHEQHQQQLQKLKEQQQTQRQPQQQQARQRGKDAGGAPAAGPAAPSAGQPSSAAGEATGGAAAAAVTAPAAGSTPSAVALKQDSGVAVKPRVETAAAPSVGGGAASAAAEPQQLPFAVAAIVSPSKVLDTKPATKKLLAAAAAAAAASGAGAGTGASSGAGSGAGACAGAGASAAAPGTDRDGSGSDGDGSGGKDGDAGTNSGSGAGSSGGEAAAAASSRSSRRRAARREARRQAAAASVVGAPPAPGEAGCTEGVQEQEGATRTETAGAQHAEGEPGAAAATPAAAAAAPQGACDVGPAGSDAPPAAATAAEGPSAGSKAVAQPARGGKGKAKGTAAAAMPAAAAAGAPAAGASGGSQGAAPLQADISPHPSTNGSSATTPAAALGAEAAASAPASSVRAAPAGGEGAGGQPAPAVVAPCGDVAVNEGSAQVSAKAGGGSDGGDGEWRVVTTTRHRRQLSATAAASAAAAPSGAAAAPTQVAAVADASGASAQGAGPIAAAAGTGPAAGACVVSTLAAASTSGQSATQGSAQPGAVPPRPAPSTLRVSIPSGVSASAPVPCGEPNGTTRARQRGAAGGASAAGSSFGSTISGGTPPGESVGYIEVPRSLLYGKRTPSTSPLPPSKPATGGGSAAATPANQGSPVGTPVGSKPPGQVAQAVPAMPALPALPPLAPPSSNGSSSASTPAPQQQQQQQQPPQQAPSSFAAAVRGGPSSQPAATAPKTTTPPAGAAAESKPGASTAAAVAAPAEEAVAATSAAASSPAAEAPAAAAPAAAAPAAASVTQSVGRTASAGLGASNKAAAPAGKQQAGVAAGATTAAGSAQGRGRKVTVSSAPAAPGADGGGAGDSAAGDQAPSGNAAPPRTATASATSSSAAAAAAAKPAAPSLGSKLNPQASAFVPGVFTGSSNGATSSTTKPTTTTGPTPASAPTAPGSIVHLGARPVHTPVQLLAAPGRRGGAPGLLATAARPANGPATAVPSERNPSTGSGTSPGTPTRGPGDQGVPPPVSPVAHVASWQAVQPIQVLSSPIRRLPDESALYRAMVSPYGPYSPRPMQPQQQAQGSGAGSTAGLSPSAFPPLGGGSDPAGVASRGTSAGSATSGSNNVWHRPGGLSGGGATQAADAGGRDSRGGSDGGASCLPRALAAALAAIDGPVDASSSANGTAAASSDGEFSFSGTAAANGGKSGTGAQDSGSDTAAAAAAAGWPHYNPLASPLPQLSLYPYGLFCGDHLIRPTSTRQWGLDPLQQLRATQTALDATIAAAFGVPTFLATASSGDAYASVNGNLSHGQGFQAAAAGAGTGLQPQQRQLSFGGVWGVGGAGAMGGSVGGSTGSCAMVVGSIHSSLCSGEEREGPGGSAGSSGPGSLAGSYGGAASCFGSYGDPAAGGGPAQQASMELAVEFLWGDTSPVGASAVAGQVPAAPAAAAVGVQVMGQAAASTAAMGHAPAGVSRCAPGNTGSEGGSTQAPGAAGPAPAGPSPRPDPVQQQQQQRSSNTQLPQPSPTPPHHQPHSKAGPGRVTVTTAPGPILHHQQQQQPSINTPRPTGHNALMGPMAFASPTPPPVPGSAPPALQGADREPRRTATVASAATFAHVVSGAKAPGMPPWSNQTIRRLFTSVRVPSAAPGAQPAAAAAAQWWTAEPERSSTGGDGAALAAAGGPRGVSPTGSSGGGAGGPRWTSPTGPPPTLPHPGRSPAAALASPSPPPLFPLAADGGAVQRVRVTGPWDTESITQACLQGRLDRNVGVCGTVAAPAGSPPPPGPPPLHFFQPLGAALSAVQAGGTYLLVEGWGR